MTDAQELAANKRLVIDFYDAVLNRGDVMVADRTVAPDYIEHSPEAADGRDALKTSALERRRAHPASAFAIVRTLAENDLVAVHVHITRFADDLGLAGFDIYRVQDGLLAEHWDVRQPVPASTASGNDMFSTLSEPRVTEPDESAPAEETRQVGTAMYDQVLVNMDVTGYDVHTRGYRQHTTFVADGPEGGKAGLSAFFEAHPTFESRRKRVIVDGDLLLSHSNMIPVSGTRGQAVMDLVRVRDGKVVEHWDVIQDIPATSANDNGMF